MATISIEEKARRYDEAIKVAKSKIRNDKDHVLYEDDVIEIFPELVESEDERIRNVLIDYFNRYKEQEECGIKTFYGIPTDNILTWLEKQGEHANFRNKIQIGDKVTRNEDGVLVNLSQLERLAKPNESKQGEQKPAWSEEDESHIRYLIECLEHCKKGVALTMTTSTSQEYINWLKALRPQSQWEPSSEQMEVLQWCMPLWAEPKSKAILESLINDLKKLREE